MSVEDTGPILPQREGGQSINWIDDHDHIKDHDNIKRPSFLGSWQWV